MAPREIQKMLKREPFTPFKIYVADGSVYEVLSPGDAAVSALALFVGIDPDESGLPRNSVYISPNLVSRIVPMPTSKAS